MQNIYIDFEQEPCILHGICNTLGLEPCSLNSMYNALELELCILELEQLMPQQLRIYVSICSYVSICLSMRNHNGGGDEDDDDDDDDVMMTMVMMLTTKTMTVVMLFRLMVTGQGCLGGACPPNEHDDVDDD